MPAISQGAPLQELHVPDYSRTDLRGKKNPKPMGKSYRVLTGCDPPIKVFIRHMNGRFSTPPAPFHLFAAALMSLPVLVATTWGDDLPGAEKTALDRYIAKPDPAYGYELVRTLEGPGYKGFILKMRSQTWRTKADVDRVLWEHDMRVVVPAKVKSETGLLFIGGGRNGREAPDGVDENLAKIAMATGTVITELGQVPNQPLTFLDDPNKEDRYEDSLIAYTWDKFLRGGDEEWLARLPMTKSAVRAMDTITDFCQGDTAGRHSVKKFVVAGGSKRGWTTWTTAAVDSRVEAIVPIVIDMLNVRKSFQHHHSAYGFFAPAVGDYEAQGIMDWEKTQRYEDLLKQIEPYEFRGRFTMPKLLVNATGDQFFLPDSSQFYFDDLPGEKLIRYVTNADHSLKGSDAYETLLAYYSMILTKQKRPEFTWTSQNEGHLKVTVKDKPKEVRLWQATNPEKRDFRKDVIGEAWRSSVLEAQDGHYEVKMVKPEKGWTAFLIELAYESPAKVPLKLTTSVDVVPRALPFKPYVPKDPLAK